MNGYNSNYFNRQTVNSMKSALTQVLSERFPGTEQGQPGLGIGQISDLELQKRMRNKKNTSIFDKNPKQSKEYLELEAEYNKRQAANAPKTTQSVPAATPATSGGSKPLFAPSAPSPSPSPVNTAPTGISVPSTITPKEPPTSPMFKPAPNFPSTRITTTSGTGVNKAIAGVDPTSLPPAGQEAMRAAVSTPAAQQQAFKAAEKTAYGQNVSGQGAYSPKDTASAKRGLEADIAAGFRSVTSDSTAPVRYAGAPIPNQNKIPASTYTPQPASPQELQAARNAAPAPAGWLQNYEMRAKAAKARAGKPRI